MCLYCVLPEKNKNLFHNYIGAELVDIFTKTDSCLEAIADTLKIHLAQALFVIAKQKAKDDNPLSN